jgi:antitoxin HicB
MDVLTLRPDEDGRYVATAPDVPEAITDGADRQEALKEISEALGAALAGYVLERKELPRPSKAKRGQYLVPVAPLVAAKLILRAAMREEGVSNVALASRLGLSEGAVRRLVDPDHALPARWRRGGLIGPGSRADHRGSEAGGGLGAKWGAEQIAGH